MGFAGKLETLHRLEGELQESVKCAGHEDVATTRLRYQYHPRCPVGTDTLTALCIHRISLACRDCLLDYPREAHAENVDAALWRICFHAPIDYYRRFLKGGSQTPERRWAISEVNRLIDTGIAFFANLLHDLVVRPAGSDSHDTPTLSAAMARAFAVLGLPPGRLATEDSPMGLEGIAYRLLIFCGDLARYRSQFNRTFPPDRLQWAWRLYQVARQLDLDHGHASNQLAVVCSLRGEVLLTIWWYGRAECCLYPFGAARANLLAFLEKTIASGKSEGEGGGEGKGERWMGLVHFVAGLLRGDDRGRAAELSLSSLMPPEMTRLELALLLMILLALRRLYPDEECLVELFSGIVLELFSDGIVLEPDGHSADQRALLLVSTMAALRLLPLRVTVQSRLLRWVVGQNDLIVDDGVRSALGELGGFDVFESFHFQDLPAKSQLVIALIETGLAIEGLVVRNGLLYMSDVAATPQDASSPLVLFAPPSSERPSPGNSIVGTDELDEEDVNARGSEVDEIVLFRGWHPGSGNASAVPGAVDALLTGTILHEEGVDSD